MPLFSIGVTTYDRVELLLETLSSIAAQDFSDFEVIVGNDNPDRILNAETLGIDDPRITYVNHPVNLGELDNMNFLLRAGRGRYFTWLADDDLYAPNFLSTVYEALRKYDYPDCVFTSFRDIRDAVIPEHGQVRSEDITVFNGREFLRRYLARELKAIGVMGLFDRDYLNRAGGLEDVSADGKGLYCEYTLMVRAGLLERIAYVDAPLVFFRVHEGSWRIEKTDLAQYQRASANLVQKSIECFVLPQLVADLDQNLTNLLKWFMSELVTAWRRVRPFRFPQFVSLLFFARDYINSLKGSKLYKRALWCLLKADLWLTWTLFRQAFLATAPPKMIGLANFIRSFWRRDRLSNASSSRGPV